MNKKEKLLNEYSESVGGDINISIVGFLDFLVDKIEKFEDPSINTEITLKGGETNGNSKEKQSETPQ